MVNKNIKGLILIKLLLILSILLGACQSEVIIDNDNSKKSMVQKNEKLNIGIVAKYNGISSFYAAERGARVASRDLNINLVFKRPENGESNSQEMIIEDLIKNHIDVLCVDCNDATTLTNVLAKAKTLGIRVVTWDSDCEREGRDVLVLGADPEKFGRYMMDYIAKLMDYKGEFAIVSGAMTSANINEWVRWTQAQLKEKYKNMNMVTVVPSEDNEETAYLQAKRILNAYPNIGGIIGYSSSAGPGVAKAVEEAGLNGKVKVTAAAAPSVIRQYLQSNACQASVLYDVEKMGYLTVAVAVILATQNRIPEDGEDMPTLGKIRLNENNTVILGDPIDINITNVDGLDF